MVFNEPRVEFIPIDLKERVVAKSVICTDSVTDGGTYCVDSSVTTDCGTPMHDTN